MKPSKDTSHLYAANLIGRKEWVEKKNSMGMVCNSHIRTYTRLMTRGMKNEDF